MIVTSYEPNTATDDAAVKPAAWKPQRARSRQTMVEFVRDSLRNAILSGELTGGSRLVQADLASALEVSTTPIREALRELVSEGLVRFDPHRGAVVCETSADELEEIYQMCRVLEPIAVREALARADDALVTELRRLHTLMITETDPVAWMDLNRGFHRAIYESAGKPRLAAVILNLRDARAMFIGPVLTRNPKLLQEVNHHHDDIIAAIELGEPEAAVDAILRHLSLAVEVINQD